MITDQLTKSQFVVDTLNRDVQNIFKAQRLIVEQNKRLQGKELKQVQGQERIGKRTGRLLDSVQNPKFNIVGVDGRFQVRAYVPLHMRFLDMRHLGNWGIYTRQILGILNNKTYWDIKFGYGEQIHDTIGYALSRAFDDTKK